MSPTKRSSPASSPTSDTAPIPSPSKRSKASPKPSKENKPRKVPTAWSRQDRLDLLARIDSIITKTLWDQVKDDPRYKWRQSAGVKGHWQSIYKKMIKEVEAQAKE